MNAHARLREMDFLARLRRKDASIWSDDPVVQAKIRDRLGWVTIHRSVQINLDEILALGKWVRELDFRHAVLLGMGGSSLAPEVFQRTFGAAPGFPELIVLDSTDPSAIIRVENRIEPETTLFIVSSKSGTTLETSCLQRYFEERTRDATGDTATLDNFVAITDPDSSLYHMARAQDYHRVFVNPPDIGGRYSALSFFGLVPAAAIGVDVERLLREVETLDWEEASALGARLGELAEEGRDKVTFLPGEGLESFGAWAEQLIAESTGKQGKGLVPIDGEPAGLASVYGDDRAFVYLDVGDHGDEVDSTIHALESAGHPIAMTTVDDPYQLGREFLRWEIATAAIGAILGINPFDEPNVAESKENTGRVLAAYASVGELPDGEPSAEEDGLALYMDDATAASLREAEENTIPGLVSALFQDKRPPQFAATMAYIAHTEEHDRLLAKLRTAIRDTTLMSTTVGYGPRFLHSTGQLHKGGPATGVFFQITADDPVDLDIPGESGYTFSVLKQAQALGDLQALQSRGLPAIRVHLRGDITASLRQLVDSIEATLTPRIVRPGRME